MKIYVNETLARISRGCGQARGLRCFLAAAPGAGSRITRGANAFHRRPRAPQASAAVAPSGFPLPALGDEREGRRNSIAPMLGELGGRARASGSSGHLLVLLADVRNEWSPPPRRAPDDEMLDPATKQTYVVYRCAELPTAQTQVVDPLLPEEVLHLGMVSTKFNVVVPRPGFDEEKHRLLLFLRMKDKVKAPADKPAYEETIDLFAKDRIEELLDRYGGRGVYEKAKRLPIGSIAGLPSICHSNDAGALYCDDCDPSDEPAHCSACGVEFENDDEGDDEDDDDEV